MNEKYKNNIIKFYIDNPIIEYYNPPNINIDDYEEIEKEIEENIFEIDQKYDDLYEKTEHVWCTNEGCFIMDETGSAKDLYAKQYKKPKKPKN